MAINREYRDQSNLDELLSDCGHVGAYAVVHPDGSVAVTYADGNEEEYRDATEADYAISEAADAVGWEPVGDRLKPIMSDDPRAKYWNDKTGRLELPDDFGPVRTVMVTERALVQRVNRKLAPVDQRLRRSRPFFDVRGGDTERVSPIYDHNIGRFYLVDVRINGLVDTHVDLEALAREVGCIAECETLEGAV